MPSLSRRLALGIVLGLAVAVAGGLVVPRCYEVEGVSMGPGLLPGDRVCSGWLPCRDRWRRPGRFERWIVVLPDGTTGLKRIIGLPGESLSIARGDLIIDGAPVVKSPRWLSVMGSLATAAGDRPATDTAWALPPTLILDDADFATEETARLLLPVQDVGLVAVVEQPAAEPLRVQARVGHLAITWRLERPGRHAVIAGRLDGHAVAAAWLLPEAAAGLPAERHCLPPCAPDHWDVAVPWPSETETTSEPRSPRLALTITAGGTAPTPRIAAVHLWRDILHRPAADGIETWTLGADEFLMCGDFPAASRDSRHFGPLRGTSLRYRIEHTVARPH